MVISTKPGWLKKAEKNEPTYSVNSDGSVQSNSPGATSSSGVTITRASDRNAGNRGSSYSYRSQGYKPISYKSALSRALEQYEPLREKERTSAGVINQQQANLLGQAMNARGQLGGGVANQAAIGQSNEFQRLLSDIDTNFDAQAATLAQNMVLQDQSRADMLNQQDFSNQMAVQGANRSAFESDRAFDQQVKENALTRALNQEKFDFEKEQYYSTPQAQPDYIDIWRRGAEADIAATERSNTGGGSGGFTDYQLYQMDRNDQQDIRNIDEEARSRALKDTRRWEGSEAQKAQLEWLAKAYMELDGVPYNANVEIDKKYISKAMNDDRYRYPAGDTLMWLKQAYIDMGYDDNEALEMAKNDDRYKSAAGDFFLDNDLYEAYKTDLIRQQYGLPTAGNPL